MLSRDVEDLKSIRDFPSLVEYLRDELGWPLDADDVEDLAYDYDPEELGLDPQYQVKIRKIKQIRPLVTGQPWGVFYIDFEAKRLPVVVLRRILRSLVVKKRASAAPSERAVWNLNDLLFISALGEPERRNGEVERGISFAHFRDSADSLPQLQTFYWDQGETNLFYIRNFNLERLRWPDNTKNVEEWRTQWSSAFPIGHREVIATSKDLSLRLADLAKRTRDLVLEIYRYEARTGPLHRLHDSFRTVLVHDLDVGGFADMVAQTIAYGLFSARATGEPVLGLVHLEAMIPNTNPFLRDLFAEFTKISGHQKGQIDFDELGVAEIVDLLRNTDIEAVLRDFGRQTGGGIEDPVIHFYELFLSEYDREQKVQRGVFYTPKPVVSFIVRSVDDLLRTELGCPDGLADISTMEWKGKAWPKVMILDPAAGTGTFLESVIEVIHETMVAKWEKERKSEAQIKQAWNEYVPKHLLPRLHGFELMMAPYAVAHMKLGLKLRETGYEFQSEERLRLFLTNTLEPPRTYSGQLFAEFLANEAEAANKVKRDTPITVVLGNPPYSAISANLTPELRAIVDDYRFVAGERIRERSMLQFEKNIQDDYIKFIAKAQKIVSDMPHCIIGYVTNHSYLDGPTLRGMRWNLMSSFDRIDILDLHGNSNKKEKAPDGGKDENVFDIQQGVAIAVFRRDSRRGSSKSMAEVCHGDTWGSRQSKYHLLGSNTIQTLELLAIHPSPEYYYFVPSGAGSQAEEWELGMPITSVLTKYSTGTETGFDSLLLAFERDELLAKIRHFADTGVKAQDLRNEYGIDGGHAETLLASRHAFDIAHWSRYVNPLQFRPFDYRWAYLKKELLKTNSFNVMQELGEDQVGLVATRQTKETFGIMVVAGFCGHKVTSSYDRSYVFPLWATDYSPLLGPSEKRPALAPEFVRRLSTALGLGVDRQVVLPLGISAQQVFHYIVAVLSSLSYRKRYSEYLKREFPRVPVTSDRGLFDALSVLGGDIAAFYLLNSGYDHASWNSPTAEKVGGPFNQRVVRLIGRSSPEVAKGYPEYSNGRLLINDACWIEGISDEVWKSHIGGFQVCDKWLRDRRGILLSDRDIDFFNKIVVALGGIIRCTANIDEAIASHGGWPLR